MNMPPSGIKYFLHKVLIAKAKAPSSHCYCCYPLSFVHTPTANRDIVTGRPQCSSDLF